jgi:ribosomal protein S18 acetylase RimI-like enzyme
VAPAVRGGGLGRQLCLHLIAAALRATRANTVTLRAYRDNTAAVTLYQSLGFIEDVTKSTDAVLFMSLHAAQFAG